MQLRGKVMSSAAEFNATGAENEVPKSDEKSHTEELTAVLKNIEVDLKGVGEILASLEDRFAEEHQQHCRVRHSFCGFLMSRCCVYTSASEVLELVS